MADEHGLAIGPVVTPYMLFELNEERCVGIELALQRAVGDLLVQGIEAQKGGGVVQTAHVELGSCRLEGEATALGADEDAGPPIHGAHAAHRNVGRAAEEVSALV